jgi:hypothetical protein
MSGYNGSAIIVNITLWSRVNVDKIVQLIKKLALLFGGELMIHYRVQKSPPPVPILNPDHTFIPCFLKIHFNIITSLFGSPKRLYSYSDYNFVYILYLMRATRLVHLTLLDLKIVMIRSVWWSIHIINPTTGPMMAL